MTEAQATTTNDMGDRELQEWDRMAPVGREFGSPDYERLEELDQLELHYQPVVDLRSGEIVGAEAHKADQAAPALYGPEKRPERPARAS